MYLGWHDDSLNTEWWLYWVTR